MNGLLKSRRLSAAILAGLGIALGIALSLRAAPSPIPALSRAGEAGAAALEGRTRREVHAAWGEPDGMLSGFFGDIYRLNETDCVIVYYDTEPMNEGIADADTVPVLYTIFTEA